MVRLDPNSCTIVVIDVQEKLAGAMESEAISQLERSARILLEAADELGVHVVASEQYPKGLGPTVPSLRERLQSVKAPILEKVDFSIVDAPGFMDAWSQRLSRSAIVVGMESHVCVYQSVRDLIQRGVDVHVMLDGVASRRADHRQVGLDLCRALGATVSTTETVVFDWLRRAGSDSFKRLSKAIR